MCGIVDAGAYNFTAFFLPQPPRLTATPWRRRQCGFFSILGHSLVILSLSLLSGTGVFAFFCHGLIKLVIKVDMDR
jgi:hypothetical protein